MSSSVQEPDLVFDVTATKPFSGIGNPYGVVEVSVIFACGNDQLTKPMILVEGFDPNTKINPTGAFTINDAQNYVLSGLPS